MPWEPIINNMTTERTLVTIDGMVTGACTDKMDPITSYKVSNLSSAKITNWATRLLPRGTTIGGAINLEKKQKQF